MRMKFFWQKKRSFSNLEIILAAIAVGSTLMALYFGWQIKHLNAVSGKTGTSLADTVGASPTPKPVSSGNDYASIPRWGVRFQYGDNLAGIDVAVISNSGNDTVGLTSTQMLAKDGGCDAASGALGTLTRYAPGSLAYGSPVENNEDAMKIGHYYYVYSTPTVSCSQNPDAQVAQSSQSAVLSADLRATLELDSEPLQY
jgi:hypothetical protein